MKIPALSCVILLLGLLPGAGCAYMEVTKPTDADRVLTGTVAYLPPEPVPDGAILSIRVVDNSSLTSGPVLLGQQRIAISGQPPFEFRAEYRAEDDLMRRGVNVEAKILVNGKLRYGNLTAYVVSLGRSTSKQEINLLPAAP